MNVKGDVGGREKDMKIMNELEMCVGGFGDSVDMNGERD